MFYERGRKTVKEFQDSQQKGLLVELYTFGNSFLLSDWSQSRIRQAVNVWFKKPAFKLYSIIHRQMWRTAWFFSNFKLGIWIEHYRICQDITLVLSVSAWFSLSLQFLMKGICYFKLYASLKNVLFYLVNLELSKLAFRKKNMNRVTNKYTEQLRRILKT